MSTSPQISIVIPTYNSVGWIRGCLNSIDVSDVEVIIIDDCSTDGTQELIESMIDTFPFPIKLMKLVKNIGPGYCRNIGMKQAHCDHVLFMDSDDQYIPGALAKVIECKGKADIVHFSFYEGNNTMYCFDGYIFFRDLMFRGLYNTEFIKKYRFKQKKALDVYYGEDQELYWDNMVPDGVNEIYESDTFIVRHNKRRGSLSWNLANAMGNRVRTEYVPGITGC